MPKKKAIKSVPTKEWTWNHSTWGTADNPRQSYDGVTTNEGQLLWFHQVYPGWLGEAATTQTFEDFLAHGPSVDGVPADVIAELQALLSS